MRIPVFSTGSWGPVGPPPALPPCGRLRNWPEKLSVPKNVSVPAPKSMTAKDGLAPGVPNETASDASPSRAENCR